MKIESLIKNPVAEKDGVFFLQGHKKFAYNDGDRPEQYVFEVIRKAQDISSDSRELEAHIRDWPSLYHLSRERSLAYQSLNIPATASILEIGCGCGSITRLLGERAGNVLALEGSARRAAITRSRTRDLNTVKVLCASFEEVVFDATFDVVICNGVLEYASLFVKHEEPHRRMLELLAPLVRPGGSFVVAIENKLGLRYFASGREEHTNIMFDGLEGYAAHPKGARTFGAAELRELLGRVFPSVETCLPLPDYKLPTALIRAELLDKVNCAELFANTARHDFGSQTTPLMHERLVWHELQKNGQLGNFANSFFIIAGDRKTSLLEAGWMGDIYSIRRKPELAVRTSIRADAEGRVLASKAYLRPGLPRTAGVQIRHTVGMSEWSNGASVHTLIARALMRRGRTSIEERIRAPVLTWWETIKSAPSTSGGLSGAVLDQNWQNTLVEFDRTRVIDGEWEWPDAIEATWLIYRVVMKFVADEEPYSRRWSKVARKLTPYGLMKSVGKIVGIDVNAAAVQRAAALERILQRGVSGRQFSQIRMLAQVVEPLGLKHVRRASGELPLTLRRKLGALLRA